MVFPFYQQQMLADQNHFLLLVPHFTGLYYDAVCRSFRVVALFLYGNKGAKSVLNKDGLYKSQTVVSVRHGVGIDGIGRQPNSNTKDERSVRHALPKWLRFAPLSIHVVRIEVSCLPGVEYDIGFRDRASAALALRTYLIILKKLFRSHNISILRAVKLISELIIHS